VNGSRKSEIYVSQGERFDILEGGKVVWDRCEGFGGDPFELVVLSDYKERT
jgi:hypothetical protein